MPETEHRIDANLCKLPFLVADANESLQHSMAQMLTEAGAANCIPIGNGADAWQIWKNSRELGVIVADVKLPEMTGLELVRQVRTDRLAKIQPVMILLTAEEDSALLSQALSAGADGVLTKPFTREDLVAMVIEGTQHRLQAAGADVFAQRVLEKKILQSKLRAELIFERYRTEVECDELTMEGAILVVDNNYGLGTVLNFAFLRKDPGLEPFYKPIRGTVTKIERIPHEYGTFRVHVKFNAKPKEPQGIHELMESAAETTEPA